MTTYFAFAPGPTAPFSFQPVLDGQTYNATIIWNLFSQRWYLNLFNLTGSRIFSLPVLGSSAAKSLANLSWQAGTVTATTEAPHSYPIGTIIALTISQAMPSGYNGTFDCFVADPSTFKYTLASDPDPATTGSQGINTATAAGQFSYDVSLTRGYFDSSLVYRAQSGNFEVNP